MGMEPNKTLICEYLYNFPEGAEPKNSLSQYFTLNPHSHAVICASPRIPACRQAGNLDLELRKLLYYPLYYEAGGAKVIFRR